MVINTHKELFRYTRGVSSASDIFQHAMKNVLQDIEISKFQNDIVYLDDILLPSAIESEHLQLIDQVLGRLEKAGLRARKEKCQFFVSHL